MTWNATPALAREFCEDRKRVELFEDCDGYKVLTASGIDTSVTFYYDQRGRMVSYSFSGMGGENCFGQPPPVSDEKLESCAKQDCESLRRK
jgi:hypothetical protein